MRLPLVALSLIVCSPVFSADPPNPVGMPKKGDPGGGIGAVRLWYEDGTWHLRTSTESTEGKKDKLMVFTGTVRSEGKVTAEAKLLEKGARRTADALVPHPDGKGFDFRFATFGARDQVDFTVADAGKTLKFKLAVDGEKAPPHRILIGADGTHPEKAEFTLPAKPKK